MSEARWRPIEEVYPDAMSDGRFWGTGDYEPLLRSFGYDIVLKKDEDDYQGSSWVLLRDGNWWGYLEFGWGSCSGCDALQACNSYEEIDQLRKELHDGIKWGSVDEMLRFFQEHDWEGDWSYRYRECREFVAEAIRILGERPRTHDHWRTDCRGEARERLRRKGGSGDD